MHMPRFFAHLIIIALTLIPATVGAEEPQPAFTPQAIVYAAPEQPATTDLMPQILAPMIQSIALNALPLRAPGPFVIVISTRVDVATISIEIAKHRFSIPLASPGTFTAQGRLPWLPFFLKKTYTATISATLADGTQQSVDVDVPIR